MKIQQKIYSFNLGRVSRLKYYVFFLLLLIVTSYKGAAQDPEFEWAKRIGSTNNDFGYAIDMDSEGNVYTTGSFRGTVDFDPGSGVFNLSSTQDAIFILKLNSVGAFVWAKQLGGGSNPNSGYAISIFVDNEGNVYTTGQFSGVNDFDPGNNVFNLTSFGGTDVFISKLNSEGEFIWAKQIGGTNSEGGRSLIVDGNQNVFITGFFYGTVDFDPDASVYNITSAGSTDIFVVKLDSDGDFEFAKQVSGIGQQESWAIKVDGAGNILITGFFYGLTDFNPGYNGYELVNSSGSDLFVLKLDSGGGFIWVKQIGATTNGGILDRDMAIDEDGNIYVTGYFGGPVDFDPGPDTVHFVTQSDDVFVLKLSNGGNLIWVNQLGAYPTSGSDQGSSIKVHNDGTIYVTGTFFGTGDFDPGSGVFTLTSLGGAEIFLARFTNSGNFIWAGRMGGTGPDNGHESVIGPSNEIYTCGNFRVVSDFDPSAGTYNLTSAGLGDIFISKLTQPCEAVEISDHPADKLSNTCDNATFSISATGTNPITYAWFKNGIIIPDAPGSVYTTPQLTMADNGNTYHCVVSNCAGEFMETSDDATLTVQVCVASQPNISLSASVAEPSENLTITGSGFTPGGEVDLTIRNELGENIGDNIPITYPEPGLFTFILPVMAAFIDGTYFVSAQDIETGNEAPGKTFFVNNPVSHPLKIVSPTSGSSLFIGEVFDIAWNDEVDPEAILPIGFVEKMYTIEISTNGGASWIWVKNHFGLAYANQVNKFSFQYSVNTTAPIIIRVTDSFNVLNTDQTSSIDIESCNTDGFIPSLEWDQTVQSYRKPIGLAADGTARILIKLTKQPNNTKQVSSIEASIETVANDYSGPALLGKIMYATQHATYSEEANVANSTNVVYSAIDNGNQNSNEFWFWVVAPDDYANTPADESAERKITIDFTFHYTDNTDDIIQMCSPISIYRPPLVFVHGIHSDAEAFRNARYLTGSSALKYFHQSDEWAVIKRVNLKAYSSFTTNADILLEKDGNEDVQYQNSLKSVLHDMHIAGIASKRVDYVCHSMGGAIGRTVINSGSQWYSPGIGRYRNYGKGYINKFITICTPHNGSYIADLTIDLIKENNVVSKLQSTPGFLLKKLFGLSKEEILNIINTAVAGALKDLQTYSGGVVLTETPVSNHLISADIDFSNLLSEEEILFSLGKIPGLLGYNIFKYYKPNSSIHDQYQSRYGTSDFLSQSDGIVQLSSQLAGKPVMNAIDISINPTSVGTTSITYGLDKFHPGVQTTLVVGNRVKWLLNAKMNSGNFASTIPANSLPQHLNCDPNGSSVFRNILPPDTILAYVDTISIKISSPELLTLSYVDSSVYITIHLKDTAGFQNLRVAFQSDFHVSEISEEFQVFEFHVQPDLIGCNTILAIAEYDSLGYTVHHIDTLSLVVSSLDTLQGFKVSPKAQALSPGHIFEPEYHLFFPTFIGLLDPSCDSLSHSILDTNVVIYDSTSFMYVAKDTGTTSVIFTYNGLQDTIAVYITSPIDKNIATLCPTGNTIFFSGISDITKTYQWQVDTSGVFVDIIDNAYYTGTDSSTLVINGTPSQWYNNRYRCIISDAIGYTISDVFTLRFRQSWTGAVNTSWENPGNWSCSVIPDAYTDVFVSTGLTNYPIVNSNAVCRKLDVKPGATVQVNAGYELILTGND